MNTELIGEFYENLDGRSREALDCAIAEWVRIKKAGGKVTVVTGSGPNLHEGVTTLIAELISKGLVDGVTTSSAVVAHEMAGSLDRVKMCPARQFDLEESRLPRGDVFELTRLTPGELLEVSREMHIDRNLIESCECAEGHDVVKAAGNMAYPMGLRTERLAGEVLAIAQRVGLPFETVAGWGCDPRTMLGAGALSGVPVLVTLPQIVGGGHVGMSVGDSIPISQRSARIAQMMGDSDMIVESAVALTQEIHDGPFETYTGHGIWSWWQGMPVYSLREKTLVRIDMDENLRRAQDLQKDSAMIQEAIEKGLPKTKISKIPFRMEMSAFSRLEKSLPVIGDIGEVWPVLASRVAEELGTELGFMSYKQETEEGRAMREWIVENVRFLDRDLMMKKARELRFR